MYGIYFPGERAAFSAASLAQTIGLFIGASFSTFLCARLKIYTFAGIIVTSLVCYTLMNIKHSKQSKISDLTKLKLEKIESTQKKNDSSKNSDGTTLRYTKEMPHFIYLYINFVI